MHLQLTSNTAELNRLQYLSKKSRDYIKSKHSRALNLLKTEEGWWDSFANKSICCAKPMAWKPPQKERINFWSLFWPLHMCYSMCACVFLCKHTQKYINMQTHTKIYKIKNIIYFHISFCFAFFFWVGISLGNVEKLYFCSHHKMKMYFIWSPSETTTMNLSWYYDIPMI